MRQSNALATSEPRLLASTVIFGASSGIGNAIARELLAQGKKLVLATHRPDETSASFRAFADQVTIIPYDALRRSNAARTTKAFSASFATRCEQQLYTSLFTPEQKIDAVYMAFGTGELNPGLSLTAELSTIEMNCEAFATIALASMRHFLEQGYGHLIAITSIAALLGSAAAPAYNASKAFQSNYLEGLRCKAAGNPKIQVTEIRPGFVNTAMMKAPKPFWVQSPELAASRIIQSAAKRKTIAYTSKRWALLAKLLHILPFALRKKLA